MKYITHRRFKGKAICGDVNIPAMTECETQNEYIVLDGKIICTVFSENAHLYFASNDDGRGMLRGTLTRKIVKALLNNDKDYQARWDKVWEDKLCQRYKRTEHSDHWLWNHSFYNADVNDLKYIAHLVGA